MNDEESTEETWIYERAGSTISINYNSTETQDREI